MALPQVQNNDSGADARAKINAGLGQTDTNTTSIAAKADITYVDSENALDEKLTNKDLSGGYVGKTGNSINFWNSAKTFLSLLLNVNTAARNYTLQDKSGTIADLDDVQGAKDYADGLVVGLWDDRGNYDASVNAYPSSGGSGVAGAILKGDIWTVSVAGTLPTAQAVLAGDTVRALIDTPGNTQANWAIAETNIGYVAENAANKSTTLDADKASDVKYSTPKSIYDWAVGLFVKLTGSNLTGPVNANKGGDLASAATVNIGAATGEFIDITGTTTITAFDTIQAGTERTLRFIGALTLTHNGTSLVLPTGANILTATNDVAIFRSLGAGNWVCVSYEKASGAALAVGGLSFWDESEDTSAPNATVPATQFTPSAAATNADAVIKAKGNGANLAQTPDNAVAGGNKRGIYATDWQKIRSNASEVASGAYATIGGGERNTSSGTYSYTSGRSNLASAAYTVAIGFGNTATDTAAVAFGRENDSTGANSFSAGKDNTASNTYSAAIGFNNTSSGIGSGAFGQANTSNSTSSMAFGASNTASATAAVALCQSNTANGSASLATGYNASTFTIQSKHSHGRVQQGVLGDTQIGGLPLGIRTTDATATTLKSNSGADASNNQLSLQTNQSIAFTGIIIGRKSGSVDSAAWTIKGLLVRDEILGSVTIVGGTVTVIDNTPTWGTPTLGVDTTYGSLKVQVIGLAVTNINWTCRIDTAETIYA